MIGLVVGVIWGGALVASVVPHSGVSWQAHVCGAVGGGVAAWLLAGRRSARSAGSGSGSGSGGGSDATRRPDPQPERRPASRSGRAPLGGHDLHDALDRAIRS